MMHYKLIDVADEISERENTPSESEFERFVGLEHYVSGEVEITNYGSTSNLDSAMKVFQSGDILVARRNVYLKRASVVFFNGLTSGDSIVLRAKNDRIARILPFLLNTEAFWDYADKHSDGTMSKRLSPKTLMKYEFDLPDEDSQDALADVLWAAASTKESYQILKNKTEQLAKAQFIDVFGDPEENPLGWKTCSIKEILEGDVSNGYFAKQNEYCEDGKAGVVCVGDVVNRKYSNVNNLRRANASEKDLKRFGIKYGDMLFCRSSLVKEGIGKASIVPLDTESDVVFECHVIRVPLNTDVCIPEYIHAFTLADYFRNQILAQAKTATMTTISQDAIVNAEIFLPPIDKQADYVSFLMQCDKTIAQAQQAIENSASLAKAIMRQFVG